MSHVLRLLVAALAAVTAGATLVVLAHYLRAAWTARSAPGRILARHVVEVSTGSLGLVVGNGYAIYTSIGETAGPPTWRLVLYLVSMLVLLTGVVEVGNLQRRRRDTPPCGEGRHQRHG